MGSVPGLPARGGFRARFISAQELPLYGLPMADTQPNILALVDAASSLIDQYCGRTDGTGMGSLVYTTYVERLLLQAAGRNIVRASFKPQVAVPIETVQALSASANQPFPTTNASPLLNTNWFWTGCQANTIQRPDTSLSAIIGCSGRYGYARRSQFAVYPDLNYGMNPLMIASFFGGPPGFVPIDCSAIDFDPQTGEMWIPAGIWMSQYTEILVTYNSGYDPRNMPRAIKDATAALTRNMLARGGGTTGLRSIQGQGMVNFQMSESDIDPTIQTWLAPFKNVIAY